jgi:hypothetical protein
MAKGRYVFIQGLLLGVLCWGALSVGLRSVHYAWEKPIPKVLLAPGRVMLPFLSPEDKQKWIASSKPTASTPVEQTPDGIWEKVKEFVGFLANLITIVIPIFSGIFSFALWRKQSRMLNAGN